MRILAIFLKISIANEHFLRKLIRFIDLDSDLATTVRVERETFADVSSVLVPQDSYEGVAPSH